MICVTIGRGRHSSLLEEWKQAAEAGAELVELRIDCLRREPELKRILKNRHTPRRVHDSPRDRRRIVAGQRRQAATVPARGGRAGRRIRRPRDGHRHQDSPVRQDKADRQLSQHEDDAGRPARHRRQMRGVRPRRGQDRHRGDNSGRGLAGLASGRPRPRGRRSRSRWARSAYSPESWVPSTVRRSLMPASIPSESSPWGCPITRCSRTTSPMTRSTPIPRSMASSATRSSRA